MTDESVATLVMSGATCGHCDERPAACLGNYGEESGDCYACDECCQHGNEDGWCISLEDIPGWTSTLDLNLTKVVEERDALAASLATATDELARLGAQLLAIRGAVWESWAELGSLDLRIDDVIDAEDVRLYERHVDAIRRATEVAP